MIGRSQQNTRLAPWPDSVNHQDEFTTDEQRFAERRMENYAGFGEYADSIRISA